MRKTRLIILLFLATFLVVGFVEAILGYADDIDSPAVIPQTLAIAVLCFAWCKADVTENGLRMPTGSRILCALIPPIGVPLHLFRTRPFRQANWATLKALGIFVASIAIYAAALVAGDLVRLQL